MTTIRNRHSIRAARTAETLRSAPLRRVHTRRASPASDGASATPRRRPAVRRLPPPTKRGVRPLLRLVVSNPSRPRRTTNGPRRSHLTLVGAGTPLPVALLEPLSEPWSDAEPRSHVLIVLGLAAAGLVALATSIGRLLSISL